MRTPNIFDIYEDSSFSFEIEGRPQPENILITGSRGMIGNAVARTYCSLMEDGLIPKGRILLASRSWPPADRQAWINDTNVTLIENHEISKIDWKLDVVIHAASPSNITKISKRSDLTESNQGILNSFLSLNPSHIVYLSSGEVYKGQDMIEGSHSTAFSENVKRDWYALSKLETEQTLFEMSKSRNVNVTIIRLFHTFGPGVKRDDGRSFADIIWGACEERRIILRSSGNQIRTFLYLSDAINAIVGLALSERQGYGIYNLGSVEPVSIKEFAERVAHITNSDIVCEVNETFPHSENHTIVPRIVKLSNYSWNPRVSLDEGIRLTVSWIKNSIQ